MGRRKRCKGLAWFYYEEIKNLSELELINLIKSKFTKYVPKSNSGSFKKGQKGIRAKAVLMYDLEWNLIKEFESAKEASEFIEVSGGSIQHACLHSKKNESKGFKWKYK